MSHRSTEDIVLFWGRTNEFSQFYSCNFEIDGVQYRCAEQWMMASKARVFNDSVNEQNILNARTPKAMKAFGRKVQNFDHRVWKQHRWNIVYSGNLAKFTQNEELKQVLLETGDKIIAEASPFDRIWGIGLGRNNAKALNPSQWRGQNLLGKVLMSVRKTLVEQSVEESKPEEEAKDENESSSQEAKDENGDESS